MNPFHTTSLFYTPWKHEKIPGFLIFSGGVEKDHWYDVGWNKKMDRCALVGTLVVPFARVYQYWKLENWQSPSQFLINPIFIFFTPLKTSENQRISDVFRGKEMEY